MIPKSVSASALENAQQCLARYKATAIERGAGMNNPAAMLGTTLHGALEVFIEPNMIKAGMWDWDWLLTCYKISFENIFGPTGPKDVFDDGRDILLKWYNRPDQQEDIRSVEIISREVKKNFPVPYVLNGSKQTVPCNYIIDRMDKMDDGVYRVVDYKSQRVPLSPEEMRIKIQPRLYALATRIEYPDAKEIWVQYDFLRHDRIAVRFSRDDNVETWEWLKRAVQRIVDTPDTNVPETLNENCRYCVRRFRCATMQSNIRVGGIHSLSVDEMVEIYHDLKSQADAISMMKDDIESQLLRHALETDTLEWENDYGRVKVTAARRRSINRDVMAKILGPELMQEYGRINVGDLDALRADDRLTYEQRSLLETAVEYKVSDPSVKVVKK